MLRGPHRTQVLPLGIAGVIAAGLFALGLPRSDIERPIVRGSFVVAFELGLDQQNEFVWPNPTFPPADYAQLLLVADQMPQVRVRNGNGLPVSLTASQALRINGLAVPALPPGTSRGQDKAPEELIVPLVCGRLRVTLVLPTGTEPQTEHPLAHIALYEIDVHPHDNRAERLVPESR